MKLFKFNQYNFLKEEFLNENNMFNQYQGISPTGLLGPGTAFAIDPGLSVASKDIFAANSYNFKKSNMINQIMNVMKTVYKDGKNIHKDFDYFLEDIDRIKELKILKIVQNEALLINVYVSFNIEEDEFFGVFKNFNSYDKQVFKSDLFTDNNYAYIDGEYCLKLSNYFYKILKNWFKPTLGYYQILNNTVLFKNQYGKDITLKVGNKVKVIDSHDDLQPYIEVEYNGEILTLKDMGYYYFNYWFEKLKNVKN